MTQQVQEINWDIFVEAVAKALATGWRIQELRVRHESGFNVFVAEMELVAIIY